MHRRLSVIFITLLVGVSATSCGQGADVSAQKFEEGMLAYEREDYSTALSIFQPLAERGNTEAQVKVGFMYEKGEGVQQDYAEARRWYLLADSAEARFRSGLMDILGQGVLTGGVPQADVSALTIEDGIAAFERDDYSTALSIFQSASDRGVARGQSNLAVMYYNGYGVPQDYVEAVRLYRLAADQGYAGGQYGLGYMYANGQGVPQDYAEAARWYRLAAHQGAAGAQSNLGTLYDLGTGVPQNDAEAARWYRLAADQGNAAAQANLDEMVAQGRVVPQTDISGLTMEDAVAAYEREDYSTALPIFQSFADQGNAVAQAKLGFMYAYGQGVTQDYQVAVRLYLLAAGQGHLDSHFLLGQAYENGRGVPQSDAEALRWYRLAAEQAATHGDGFGSAVAQTKVDEMVAQGRGVPQTDASAPTRESRRRR